MKRATIPAGLLCFCCGALWLLFFFIMSCCEDLIQERLVDQTPFIYLAFCLSCIVVPLYVEYVVSRHRRRWVATPSCFVLVMTTISVCTTLYDEAQPVRARLNAACDAAQVREYRCLLKSLPRPSAKLLSGSVHKTGMVWYFVAKGPSPCILISPTWHARGESIGYVYDPTGAVQNPQAFGRLLGRYTEGLKSLGDGWYRCRFQ